MPVTSAKTQMCPKQARLFIMPQKGQQFVQLNKNVNKTKSSQEGALTQPLNSHQKSMNVNACVCLSITLPLQHYRGQRLNSSSHLAGNVALA